MVRFSTLPCSQEPSTVLSLTNPLHATPCYPLRLILMLSTHLRLSLLSSPSGFSFWLSHQYSICIPILPHSCYMPAHHILLDSVNLTILCEMCKLRSSSLCSLSNLMSLQSSFCLEKNTFSLCTSPCYQ
jgi:hypothetical protein